MFDENILSEYRLEEDPMYLHRKLEDTELIDLLAMHTNRLTQIMISGECYAGEYDVCRRTIELIQNEVLCRRGFYINPLSKEDPQHTIGGEPNQTRRTA